MDQPARRSTTGLAARAGRGFTLIETSLALVIIGVGVLAFIEAQNSFIKNNAWSSEAATATLLATELRELSRKIPRHDPVTGLWLEGSGGSAVLHGWGPDTGETIVDDFDDMDDFDGVRFGADGDLPGPINAFGQVVAAIDADGVAVLDGDDNPVSLQGWSQTVMVEKVDPFDFSTVRADKYNEAASGSFPGRTVDQYPLRVTVIVEFQGPNDVAAREVTRVVWVVP